MQKSIKKLMPSKIDVWSDFNGFLERKWRHVGTKIDEKSMQIAKSDFLINRALAAAGAWFLRFQGSKLRAKTHQKTIKKWSQHGKASWLLFNRFAHSAGPGQRKTYDIYQGMCVYFHPIKCFFCEYLCAFRVTSIFSFNWLNQKSTFALNLSRNLGMTGISHL